MSTYPTQVQPKLIKLVLGRIRAPIVQVLFHLFQIINKLTFYHALYGRNVSVVIYETLLLLIELHLE